MKYPVHLSFDSQNLWTGTFPDFPYLSVKGVTQDHVLVLAQESLIRTLTQMLKCKGLISVPSPCRLDQQLVAIPDLLAAKITARNCEIQARTQNLPYQSPPVSLNQSRIST